ncbi:MAG: D-alanine--D-alanine ligase [Deltaproteobacteria bacterium]|nr:D-alanine--D-alanine ligase [Deltaproteobacteria bacterium]
MHIAIVHNAVDPESRADEQDVLVQATAVSQALAELGHTVTTIACTLDLTRMKQQLESITPHMVFNLVESLDGEGRLIHLFPALLDSMKLPYSGSCTETIFITSHKTLAKERMTLAGIPTPIWWGPYPTDFPIIQRPPLEVKDAQWLIKSVWEHGSLGLDDDEPIAQVTLKELDQILAERAPNLGNACFAEAFIPGREFNLSLINGLRGPEVLPPAEIIFENYDDGKLPIVGYRAKWDSSSYEYHHTPRRFDFPREDTILIGILRSLAIRCWDIFGLDGYARVDFRVDDQGNPWVLEVNSNPCLSPDAGFAAAVEQAGMTYTDAIKRIIKNLNI